MLKSPLQSGAVKWLGSQASPGLCSIGVQVPMVVTTPMVFTAPTHVAVVSQSAVAPQGAPVASFGAAGAAFPHARLVGSEFERQVRPVAQSPDTSQNLPSAARSAQTPHTLYEGILQYCEAHWLLDTHGACAASMPTIGGHWSSGTALPAMKSSQL